MSDPEPKIRCPRCGNQEARTGVYCGNCGAPLHSVVNVVNDSTIPSEYEAPNAPLVASSEQRPITGYGGPYHIRLFHFRLLNLVVVRLNRRDLATR